MLEGASGHQIRSKAENATDEVASLFHANVEVKNAKKNSLDKQKIKNEVSEDQQEIEDEVLVFFNALFNGHHNSDIVNTGFWSLRVSGNDPIIDL